MNNIDISILLPTRGRTDALERSLFSLLDLAQDPSRLQIVLGFDDDDQSSTDYFKDHIADKINAIGSKYRVLQFKPMGYVRLHEYVNHLAKNSTGRWLMFWNDDAVMHSRDWDQRIVEHDGHFRVLRMPTHNHHPYAIFPILPRRWLELFGYLSQHQLSDAWISQVAYMLDIMQDIDVEVVHDRHDLTGNNKDRTFQERIILEGRPNDPRDFNHLSARQKRLADAVRICEMLEADGQEMTWFRQVLAGKQDPWTKMLALDVNNQMSYQKPTRVAQGQ